MRFYFPIAKVDAEARMVWGYASTEAQDDQGEIVKREALAAALAEYMKFANIREMHQLSAVGRATEAGIDDKGLYVGAQVVDAPAWDKVRAGVYNGFSIGGRVTARDPADRKIITGLSLNEISLVDRPANPEAVFDCWKAEAAEAPRQPVQIWDCGADNHRHTAKAEALHCIVKSGDAPAPTEGAIAFADPGYRADGRRRYPIDSVEHIRAAWAYIHKPANRARYTAAQLAQIKERIIAAWKATIGHDGPPAAMAAGKAAAPEFLRKGLCEVARLAELVAELDWLHDRVATEAEMENDGSAQPARLQAIVVELCDLLRAMTEEETAELLDGDEAPQPADFVTMVAAPARRSLASALRKSGNPRLIGVAAALSAGRPDGAAAPDSFAALEKALADKASLARTLDDIVPRLDRLAQRVEAIAATPLPAATRAGNALPGGIHGLTKQADSGAADGGGDIVAALARMTGDERTLTLIKAARANPLRPFDRS